MSTPAHTAGGAGPEAAAPTLVFAHANGFGAGTYRVLFERWQAAGFRVRAPARLGHDPQYPVASNWRALRDELLHFIDQSVQGPFFLVGHSLGGLLSLMAAARRPERVRGLVMLDSPVISGWRAHSVHMAKLSGLMPRVSPGKISARRRHQWPSREAVHAHFVGKPVFARWDPRVLADYVATGFEEADPAQAANEEARIVLGFKREIETRIYNTLPHHLGPLLHRHPLRCPVGFIAGTQSVEIRQGGAEAARALAKERFIWFEGTHLYPMERPDDTADEVLRLIAGMG